MSKVTEGESKGSGWNGRHILIGFGLFFFAIFAANGIMVFYAISTFDGVETDNAYRKGRAYNHVLEAEAAQAALGWTVTLTVTPSTPETPDTLPVQATAIFKNVDGEPVLLEDVSVSFWRPTSQGMDVSATMTMHTSGIYEADITLAEPGNWIARVAATAANGTPFLQEERLVISPAS
ncbi:MAG: FixH family protein [Parvibaculum sp.]